MDSDPINLVSPFFYSFGPFWAKICKIKKNSKMQLRFLIFPFNGWPISCSCGPEQLQLRGSFFNFTNDATKDFKDGDHDAASLKV